MNENLKAYLDNELDPTDRQKIEQLIQEDFEVAQEHRELLITSQYIEQSAKSIDIVGLELTLKAVAPNSKRLWYKSPYAVLAACTVLIAFALNTVQPMGINSEGVSSSPNTEIAGEANAGSAPADLSQSSAQTDAEAKEPSRSPGEESVDWGNQTRASKTENQASPGSQEFKPAESRLIIKNSDVSIRVKSLENSISQVQKIASKYGGFIESSGRSEGYQVKYANFSIRVKSTQFENAMQEIRGLGDVMSESVYGNDVTAQVADSEARLKQMRIEEAQYQEVLKSAKKVSEILEVRKYINQVRQDIEATEAQIKSLRNLATLSTINLNFEQREQIKSAPRTDWLGNTWIKALNRFTGFTRTIVSTLINILVLSPFWAPFAFGIWWWTKKRKTN